MNRKKLFSLIELLITIAIIAILAGILLPALNSAREKGKAIACAGTGKQLGYALLTYTDLAGGWVLASQAPAGSWARSLELYGVLKGSGAISGDGSGCHMQSKILSCPSQEPLKAATSGIFYKYPMVNYVDTYHYGLNIYVSVRPLDGYPQRLLNRIQEPSRTFWSLETTYGITLPFTTYESGAYRAYFRHNRRMNILFMDGHVESRQSLGSGNIKSRLWRGDLPRNEILYD